VNGRARGNGQSRRDTAGRLNMLACGQPLAFVESLFGPPALSRKHGEGLTEYVFYTPHALVQLLADDVVGTRRLSITVTDRRFALDVRDLTFDQADVHLGESKFWNLQEARSGRLLWIGAHRFSYVEAHHFGASGADQLYLFSFNDAGVGDFDHAALQEIGLTNLQEGVFGDEATKPEAHSAVNLHSFRSATTVNTLTVVGALAEPGLTQLMAHGADLDYVRVFRPSTTRTRDRRR
jgi:hypothetical protein